MLPLTGRPRNLEQSATQKVCRTAHLTLENYIFVHWSVMVNIEDDVRYSVRYSQLVFEILAYLDVRKMRESRKQVENNAQVLFSI